jgi:two-component system, NtrC family, sensor histidine kinase KinB
MAATLDEFAPALYRFSRALHHLDAAQLMNVIVREASHMIDAPYACLATFNADLTLNSAVALNADATAGLWTTLLATGVVGFAYHSRRTIVIRNLATDPRWIHAPGVLEHGSAVAVPLRQDGEPFGVLMLLHTTVDYFTGKRISLLEEISGLAETALGNALEYEHLRYNGLFAEAVIPLILTDLDGYIIDVNREAEVFLRCERGDLIGSPVDVIHPAETKELHVSSLRTMQQGEEITFRTHARPVRGSSASIPVIVRARRRMYDGREVIELVEQDITAQMELEQLRRDLTAMVYHDIRNPLQTITLATQSLARALANHENPAVGSMLQTGLRASRQLRRIVDSLLDIQRMEEGKAILNLQRTDLHSLIVDAVQLVQPLSVEAEQRLKFEIADNMPVIHLDNDMMVRVIVNLLENAIKYTPKDGTITLKAELVAGGQEVRITVRDSGPGIPRHMQKQIFDKFSRVKYQDVPKGIGLGLAFCRLAVEAHGGEIWVESDSGEGSAFIFTLPVEATSILEEVTVEVERVK